MPYYKGSKGYDPMTNVSPLPLDQLNRKALALLANGLAADFAEFVQSDDAVVQALQ